MRCSECGRETLDTRWSPLCPVCFEGIHHRERRAQIRPPELESAWTDPLRLEAAFESALGRELP